MKKMKRLLSLALALCMMLSLAATPVFALEEYVVNYDVLLALGENELTLDPSAVTTVYEFTPEEAGVYKFEASDPEALVGYWGAGSFFVSDQTENKTNTLECTLANVGPSIMVGISGVESCKLTVTRVGDAEVIVEPEWEMYDNTVTPEAFTLPEGELKAVDVQDETIDTAVLGSDGCYHLNSADGPVLLASLNHATASLVAAMGYGQVRRYYYAEDGSIEKKVDFYDALNEYLDCADSYYYPLTEDIKTMYVDLGEFKGWYDANIPGNYLFDTVTVDPDEAWMFACSYIEGYNGGSGVVPEPGEPETVVLADGVMQTVTIPAGGSVNLQINATAANVTLNVNGNRTYYNWAVQIGVQQMGPNPGGFTEVELTSGMVYTLPLVNLDTEAEAVLDVTATSAAAQTGGTMENPAELVMGGNLAQIADGNDMGYWYTWTAPHNGELTITVNSTDAAGWVYQVMNDTTYASTDIHMSDEDPVVDSETMTVSKGDVIMVMVNTYDPDVWSTPAGNVMLTASFVGRLTVPSDTITLKAGESLTFQNYGNVNGMIMTVEGDVTVGHNNATYFASEGLVMLPCVQQSMIQPAEFEISSEVGGTFNVNFSYPLGTRENPIAMVLGGNAASVAEGNNQGDYYSWTAEEAGHVTVSAAEFDAEKFDIILTSSGSYSMQMMSESENGTVSIDVAAGDEVSVQICAVPDAQWNYPAVETVFDVAFTECRLIVFTDVDHAAWYHETLAYMVSNGYMSGMKPTIMNPDGQLTRAQLVTILYNVAGKPSVEGMTENFADVTDEWFAEAVTWAAAQGYVNGVDATHFNPDAPITREQLAAILYRYAGSPEVSGDLSKFADAGRVNGYAVNAMIWATQEGIINGINATTLMPRPMDESNPEDTVGLATRAQAATMLARYLAD